MNICASDNTTINADKNITNKGGSIRARVDAILKGESVINEANVKESQYKGLNQKTVGNAGSISAGQNLSINAEKDIINKGSVLAADKNLDLNAGQNVDIVTVANEKHVGVVCPGSSAEIHSVENQQSVLTGGNVNINAGSDVNIQGGLIAADKDTAIKAGGNVNINAVKDSYSEETQVGSRGGSNYYHDKVVDEKVKGTNIAGKEDISVSAGSDINIKGSSLTSEEGKASLAAGGNVNITNENEYHEKLHESHEKSSGFLSSKTTDIYDYSNISGVVSSNVSAGSVDIQSGKDTNVKGSNVVADNDVSVKAGGNLNIESAAQTSESEYIKSVKKSGLLSGGGLGFTIGKEKRKDQYANQNTEQVGSTVGSLKGSVYLEAQKDANIKGSSVIAKENINISGSNVNIENTDSIYNAQEKHEFKRSGLSVSIGGEAIDIVNSAVSHIERADDVEDKRLAALHGYKAVEDVTKTVDKNKQLIEKGFAESQWDKLEKAVQDPAHNLSFNVSIGSTKSKSESSSTTVVANGSNVKAEGDVKIISTEKDINIKGSNVEGKDVTLDAKENLNITASETTNKLEQDSKSSSSSVGVGFDIATGQVSSVTISGSKSKGEVDANSTSYNESTIKADKNLDFTSGKDTNIKGGKLSGEKVTGNVGGDLNIESKQDKNSYEEKNSSAGFGIGMPVGDKDSANKIGIFGSAGKSDVDSKYESVTDQSGIYAGKEGFDINVGENTDLKGGIISSEAEKDKNKISTGTLTYEDIKNKAEYEAGSTGINVDTSAGAEHKDAGVTPNIGVGAKDDAESTTKATVSEGEIEIRDKENQKQDLAGLNRDTKNSLNKLGEIFDKTKVEEKQEFAGMFQEIAHNYIGDLTGKISKEEKAFLNSFVDGLIAQWTSGDFLAGASGTALLESMQSAISEIEDPALKQIAAGTLGAIAGEIVSGNAQAGASGAISTERDNHLTHEQYEKMLEALKNSKNPLEATGTYGDHYVLSQEQEKQFYKEHEDDKPIGKDAHGNDIYIPENVGVDLSGNEVYLYPGPGERKFTIDKKLVATDLMKEKINSYDYTSLGAGEVYSVSQSVSYGVATVEICLTITNTGEKYQDIKILGGVDKNILEKISQLTSSSFGASYSEGTSTIYDGKNNVVNDPEKIRDTLIGTSFTIGGTMMSANKSASFSSNGNRVISNSVSNIGTSGIGGTAGISIGSYLGK